MYFCVCWACIFSVLRSRHQSLWVHLLLTPASGQCCYWHKCVICLGRKKYNFFNVFSTRRMSVVFKIFPWVCSLLIHFEADIPFLSKSKKHFHILLSAVNGSHCTGENVIYLFSSTWHLMLLKAVLCGPAGYRYGGHKCLLSLLLFFLT